VNARDREIESLCDFFWTYQSHGSPRRVIAASVRFSALATFPTSTVAIWLGSDPPVGPRSLAAAGVNLAVDAPDPSFHHHRS
jgi:hypothetical protein